MQRGGGVWRGFQPPPSKFRRPSKTVPNSTRLWKLLKIAEFRTPTPQDVRKKGSKILKLPSVRNCFTLAMTNKLVVIINSLKLPKIKENVTIWNEISCTKLLLHPEPLTMGLPSPDPLSFCPLYSTEFVEPLPNKIPGYATDSGCPHSYIKLSDPLRIHGRISGLKHGPFCTEVLPHRKHTKSSSKWPVLV